MSEEQPTSVDQSPLEQARIWLTRTGLTVLAGLFLKPLHDRLVAESNIYFYTGAFLILVGVYWYAATSVVSWYRQKMPAKVWPRRVAFSFAAVLSAITVGFLAVHAKSRSDAAKAAVEANRASVRHALNFSNELVGATGKVARLENQIAQTINAVSELNPRQQKIRSVFAFVKMNVKGVPKDHEFTDGWRRQLGIAHLSLGNGSEIKSNLWRIRLVSNDFIKWSGGDSEYSLEFHMDPHSPMWNSESITAGDVERLDALEIDTVLLPMNTEIIGGSASVTVNAAIRKEYLVPAQQLTFPSIGGVAREISTR